MLSMILTVISALIEKDGGAFAKNFDKDSAFSKKEKEIEKNPIFLLRTPPVPMPKTPPVPIPIDLSDLLLLNELLLNDGKRLPIVEPVMGSVVYCNLGYAFEHSGIYIGNKKIVHLNGDGIVEIVSRNDFRARLNGLNPALDIYVSCRKGNSVGSDVFVKRALSMVEKEIEYHILIYNCHNFTVNCMDGNFNKTGAVFFDLKKKLKEDLDCDGWGIWM